MILGSAFLQARIRNKLRNTTIALIITTYEIVLFVDLLPEVLNICALMWKKQRNIVGDSFGANPIFTNFKPLYLII